MEAATSLSSAVLMKRYLIVFYRPSPAARSIIRALEAGGFAVLSTRTIETMHILFSEQQISAAVVPRTVAREYHIRIQTHLAEAKTPIPVICWEERGDGHIATRIFSVQNDYPDHSGTRENRQLVAKAALLVRSAGTPRTALIQEARESAAHYRNPVDLPDIPGMHRKMRSIFDAIAASGNSGASPEYIVSEIWPESDKDRTRDLQSYISKLRRILEHNSRSPIRISYKNRRYRLTMHG